MSANIITLPENIPPGNYTAEQLINRLNKCYSEYDIKFEIRPHDQRVKISPGIIFGENFYPMLDCELGHILGITNELKRMSAIQGDQEYVRFNDVRGAPEPSKITPFISKEKDEWHMLLRSAASIIGSSPTDITAGYHSLYVYCDIIEPSLIGDTYSQILKVVEIPVNTGFGDQVVIKYNNPQYHRLLKHNFDHIEIDIKDDTNETIPFKFGRSIVTLHFKKEEGQ